MTDHTPVERRGDLWLKRDDLYEIGGAQGGKARTCWALAQGATGLVTAGSRQSPQVHIVASVARVLGLPCRAHTPTGALSYELRAAQAAGAEIIQHRPGHNSVIIARARADAERRGWREIPFGMECSRAVDETAGQVANLPYGPRRLLVAVGSGMSLAGIIAGCRRHHRADLEIVGVCVGADPVPRLDRWEPAWRRWARLERSALDYHRHATRCDLAGVWLDPVYEAKVLPFLQPGDLFWVVGKRPGPVLPAAVEATTEGTTPWPTN